MISKISRNITKKLLADNTINIQDQDLYNYGLFMLITQIIFFTIICVLGITLNCIFESIVFYVVFLIIRKFAGGYHAATETRCEILSTLSLLACVVVIKLSKTYDFQIALSVITLLSAICIFVLCPLDTSEKPLSEKEYKYFRKISWIILFVIVLLTVLSYCFKVKFAFTPLCMSLILESVLLIAGKTKSIVLKRKECRN